MSYTRGAVDIWLLAGRRKRRRWLACIVLSALVVLGLHLGACRERGASDLILPRTPKVLDAHALATPWDRRGQGMPAGKAKARGVILITVDTLRADHLSVYGGPKGATPNLARLAQGSVLFQTAMAQSSTTSPSHASIMTGLYPEDHNVYSNYDALGEGPVTLAKHLRAQGFMTYAIVNMAHLNPEVVNLGRGFDTFVHSGNGRGAGASFDHFLSWLDNVGDAPYFAWIHLADVHTPYKPPAPFDTMFYKGSARDANNHSLAQVWPLLPQEMANHPLFASWLAGITDVHWVSAQYQGAAAYVDRELGRLFDVLEQRRALDKTAIVFTSDHGESLGEHDMYFVHMGLYEPTVHIPLITHFPGSLRQGVQVEDVVQSVDIMPTLLDYLDVPAPQHIRGRSLWPLMAGQPMAAQPAFIEHAGRSQIALRSAQYKYIKHLRSHHIQPSYPFVAGREELYDLRRDPGELHDVAKHNPAIVRAMRAQAQAIVGSRQNLAGGKARLDDTTLDSLRALGYVR